MGKRSEHAEKRPPEIEMIPRAVNESSKRAAKPTVKQGELKLLESTEGNANDKLTLDVLKELGRTLEPAGSTSAGADMEGATVLQLVHDIPRPSRSDNAEFGAKH